MRAFEPLGTLGLWTYPCRQKGAALPCGIIDTKKWGLPAHFFPVSFRKSKLNLLLFSSLNPPLAIHCCYGSVPTELPGHTMCARESPTSWINTAAVTGLEVVVHTTGGLSVVYQSPFP